VRVQIGDTAHAGANPGLASLAPRSRACERCALMARHTGDSVTGSTRAYECPNKHVLIVALPEPSFPVAQSAR